VRIKGTEQLHMIVEHVRDSPIVCESLWPLHIVEEAITAAAAAVYLLMLENFYDPENYWG
jgi:hypothetical protein